MEIKHYKTNGIDATFIKTKKFKTITIEVVFLGEFSKEVATKKSLLTRVLVNSTKKYNTKKKVAEKLYDLYDASIGVSSYPSYKTSITVFSLDIINEKNLENNNTLTKESLEFFKEVIFNANASLGKFNKKVFNEEKRNLEDRIKSIYNNKSRFALKQLIKNMCANEIYSVSSLGELNDLENITPENLYKTYKDLLNNENVSMYVIGDFDDQEMLENLKVLGEFKSNDFNYQLNSNEDVHVNEVKEIIEKQNVNQSKLCMGFRTNTDNVGDGLYALLLLNSIFGGIYSSDLFRVIREENSLAYTIASQVISYGRLLIVTGGIDKDKYEMAVSLTKKQLEEYKNGNIDEELLSVAKDSLINELRELEDSPSYYIGHILRNTLNKSESSIDKIIEVVNNVSVDDIKRVANTIELDTIYFLTGE